ncbi:MAG: hypothetical protein AAF533_20665 [Acidobacteriota bacterium]
MKQLEELVVRGVREVLAEIRDADAGGLAGFALVTDEGMMTLHAASQSRDFAKSERGEESFFMPVDWPEEHGFVHLDEANERLVEIASEASARRAEGASHADYDERVRAVVSCLVSALATVQADDESLARALTMVICTDGGGIWYELETEAVKRLNSPELYQRYQQWAAQWSD